MTDFEDLLSPDGIVYGVAVVTKADLMRTLAAKAGLLSGVDADIIVDRLNEREALGTTGFGGGIAIPHGRLPDIDRAFGVFMRLAESIDYQSVDDMPVDCVFALFSPADDGASHLRALARISRQFRDRAFVAKLRGARSPDALFALLAHREEADAA